MAAAQSLLAQNLLAFGVELEDRQLRADYRIALTTTDVGSPLCDDATAERGAFVATSCRARLDDFVTTDGLDLIQWHRREGSCRQDGAQLVATCSASLDPSVDCPDRP